jgi:hypothetical protein
MNPNIKPPTAKDLFNLKHWATRNNLFVHPQFLKAIKTKERLLIFISFFSGIFLLLIIEGIILSIMGK